MHLPIGGRVDVTRAIHRLNVDNTRHTIGQRGPPVEAISELAPGM